MLGASVSIEVEALERFRFEPARGPGLGTKRLRLRGTSLTGASLAGLTDSRVRARSPSRERCLLGLQNAPTASSCSWESRAAKSSHLKTGRRDNSAGVRARHSTSRGAAIARVCRQVSCQESQIAPKFGASRQSATSTLSAEDIHAPGCPGQPPQAQPQHPRGQVVQDASRVVGLQAYLIACGQLERAGLPADQ